MRLEPLVPGSTLNLGDEAARAPAGAPDKDAAVAETQRLAPRIDELQNPLYAEGRRALLVVLQGRDTAGKDGTIRKVFGPLSPLGLTVASFKAPSPIELAHDYLWRIHQAVPVRGTIGVFNRSHYEDVLVVRVHALSGTGGTSTPRRTARHWRGPARRRRPGTWSPRTRNTCVTRW